MSILAATDLSERARPALQLAARLARHDVRPLHVVNVVELSERDMSVIHASFEDEEIEPRVAAVESLQSYCREALEGLATESDYTSKVLVGYPPAPRILQRADEVEAELLVVGTSGHGRVHDLFFGSTVSRLVRESNVPVLSTPPDDDTDEIRTILAPVDFSSCSRASLDVAIDMASRYDARIVVLNVATLPELAPVYSPPLVYVPESVSNVRKTTEARLEEFTADVDFAGVDYDLKVRLGRPSDEVIDAVEEFGTEIVCMGTHGREGVQKLFLGSTAERVLRQAPCPVLTVRETE